MATVFRAWDLRHERFVAIKVLHQILAETLGTDRFIREIKTAARLHHPNILPVFDSGEHDGVFWYAMPLVSGESLRAHLDRTHRLPLQAAIAIVTEVASALDYAHRQGIVHRDIKPENILLADGHALVADFGLARPMDQAEDRLTHSGVAVGTAAYMSPEQRAGDPAVDGRTDQFAVAVLTVELLTGATPRAGTKAGDLGATGLGAEERTALARALSLDAERRHPTTGDLARSLVAPRRVNRPLLLAAAAGLVIGALALWSRQQSANPPSPAMPLRLVVFPFSAAEGDTATLLAEGIADEIRGRLARIPGFEVVGSGSSNAHPGPDPPWATIVKTLGVAYGVTGRLTLERSADRNRIRVVPVLYDLTRPAAPKVRWSAPIEVALNDLGPLFATLGQQIADSLDVNLAPAVRAMLGSHPTRVPEAYQAFLRGAKHLPIDDPGKSAVGAREAAFEFERAVALDSTFAPAWAALGNALAIRYSYTPSSTDEIRSRAAAERAVRIDSTLPEAHIALGRFHLFVSHQPDSARQSFQRGLTFAPNAVGLLSGLAEIQVSLASFSEAETLLRRLARINPNHNVTLRLLSWALICQRRFAEAQPIAEAAITLDPGDLEAVMNEIITWVGRGDLGSARRSLERRSPTFEPNSYLAKLAHAWDLYWVLDDARGARLLLTRPSDFEGDRLSWAMAMAQAWDLLGDGPKTRVYADSARIAAIQQLGEAPNDAQRLVLLGLSQAYLNRRDSALANINFGIREAVRSNDLIGLPYYRQLRARARLLTGDYAGATADLDSVFREPHFLSRAWVKIDPSFRRLWGYPPFERLVADSTIRRP